MPRGLTAAICLALFIGAASADTVVLKNGDRVTGEIQSAVDGKMTIKTFAFGTVTVDMAQVETFSTDQPVKVELKDGSTLNQQVRAATAGNVELAGSETLQAQSVALQNVTAVNRPAKPVAQWQGSLTFGLAATTGNSETTTITGDMSFMRRTDDDRLSFGGYYYYGREKDSAGVKRTSKDKWGLNTKYDYFVSKRVYIFANALFEKDRVADLDARAFAGAGVGYQWIDEPKMHLSTDAGLGLQHEQYSNPSKTDNAIVAQIGWHFDRSLTDTIIFLHDFRIFPEIGNPADFRLNASAELRAKLTKAIFASAKAVMDHNSRPASGKKKTDMTYIVGVGVQF